jgi:hypothetical protein
MTSVFDLPKGILFGLLQSWLTVNEIGRLDAAAGSQQARSQLLAVLSTKALVLSDCIEVKGEKGITLVKWLNNCSIRVSFASIHVNIPTQTAVPFFRQMGPSLQGLEFSGTPNLNKSTLVATAAINCTSLKSVTLRNLNYEAESVTTLLWTSQMTVESLTLFECGERIGQFVGTDDLPLRILQVDSSLLDAHAYEILRRAPKLTVLHLSRSMHATALATAIRMPSLRSLTIRNMHYSGIGCASVFRVPNFLQVVNLERITEVNDHVINCLVQFAGEMHSLRVNCCTSITDASLQFIGEIGGARMRRLEISSCGSQLTGNGLGYIFKHCKKLECLSIQNWTSYPKLNYRKVLRKMSQLRCFDVSGNVVESEVLRTLPGFMPSLDYLTISVTPTTSLAELTQLVRTLPDLATLWVAVEAEESCRFYQEALSAVLPVVKVVQAQQRVSLWRGVTGMTSTSHKVGTMIVDMKCMTNIMLVFEQLPYEWEVVTSA